MKLLTGIGRWMSDTLSDGDETGKPIYVLDGIAGVGKSTVAKTVAQRAASINSLGASFFFSRDDANRQHASSFVHTIAYQLALCDPAYGEGVAKALGLTVADAQAARATDPAQGNPGLLYVLSLNKKTTF